MARLVRKIVVLLLAVSVMLAPLSAGAATCCQSSGQTSCSKSGVPTCPHCQARLAAQQSAGVVAKPSCCQKKQAAVTVQHSCCQKRTALAQNTSTAAEVNAQCCCQAKHVPLPVLPTQSDTQQRLRDVAAYTVFLTIDSRDAAMLSIIDQVEVAAVHSASSRLQQTLCRWLI